MSSQVQRPASRLWACARGVQGQHVHDNDTVRPIKAHPLSCRVANAPSFAVRASHAPPPCDHARRSVINSVIVKSSKLTRATKVYRGIAGGLLPDRFWIPNEQGVKGGAAVHIP